MNYEHRVRSFGKTDVERLSPLVFHHINLQGKYHFTLPEEIAASDNIVLCVIQTLRKKSCKHSALKINGKKDTS
jgi:hypothetical protein